MSGIIEQPRSLAPAPVLPHGADLLLGLWLVSGSYLQGNQGWHCHVYLAAPGHRPILSPYLQEVINVLRLAPPGKSCRLPTPRSRCAVAGAAGPG